MAGTGPSVLIRRQEGISVGHRTSLILPPYKQLEDLYELRQSNDKYGLQEHSTKLDVTIWAHWFPSSCAPSNHFPSLCY